MTDMTQLPLGRAIKALDGFTQKVQSLGLGHFLVERVTIDDNPAALLTAYQLRQCEQLWARVKENRDA